MCKYLKIFFISIAFHAVVNAQQKVDLAVQIGHSDNIEKVIVSPNDKYMVTYGKDLKIVVWNLLTMNQMLFKYVPGGVNRIYFNSESDKIHFSDQTKKTFELNIATSEIQTKTISLIYSMQDSVVSNSNEYFRISESRIFKYNNLTGKIIKSKTSDYFDQPFHHLVYSKKHDLLFAACEDGHIYVFNTKLKLIHQWKGHLSSVNSLTFFKNEDFLVSASSDRSVIIWNIKTGEIDKRISGKSFPTYGASINAAGSKLFFGDEMGYLKKIELSSGFLNLTSEKKFLYPLTLTFQTKDSTLYYSGDENEIYIQNKNGKTKKIKAIKNSVLKSVHHLFVDKLDFYQPSFSGFKNADLSPNGKLMTYAVTTRGLKTNHCRIVDLHSNKKSDKLILKGHTNINNIYFLNDSTVHTIDGDSTLCFWRIHSEKLNKISQKKIKCNFKIQKAMTLNPQFICLIGSNKIMYLLDTETDLITATNYTDAMMIFSIGVNEICRVDEKYFIHRMEFKENNFIETHILKGHSDFITSLREDKINHKMISTSLDATVKIWSLDNELNHITVIPIGSSQAIYVTNDNYYMTTGKNLNSFGFKYKNEFFLPEQFDPFYNRPDIVLERMGYVDSMTVQSYHSAYLKRLKKMGFTEEMIKSDFHLPELKIKNSSTIPPQTDKNELNLEIEMNDSKYKLDRINIYINDVPVFGSAGINLRIDDQQNISRNITLNLANGKNKIQVSVLNQVGAESYKETFYTNYQSTEIIKPDLYLVTIGVSNYTDKRYDLTYASKDATDIAEMFKKNKSELYTEVHSYTYTDKEVTKENILNLKKELMKAKRDDVVMITVAGHGVLDKNLDYYLATYDMDFSNPSEKGLAYDEVESLLDGIAPLKKVLFLDACHSGEIDKDEVEQIASNNSTKSGKIKFRDAGTGIQNKNLGLKTTSELMSELFTDLRKGTGATVISSAGGVESAMESDEWKNGLFTYCLLHGLKDKVADTNKDGKIWLSELQSYLRKEVTELSNGAQQPTSRIENLSMDFRLW